MPYLNLKSKISQSTKRQNLPRNRDKYTLDKLKRPGRKAIKNLFLDYQWEWFYEQKPFAMFVKCRRAGVSFVTAAKGVVAALTNSKDVYYSSYNLPACKEFMRNCARFARMFNVAAKLAYNVELLNENDITTYIITFANGRRIEAIPGNPVNLRDKDDCILILDEFAFRIGTDTQEELLKAVMAGSIWQRSQILVISTHNGEDTEFYKVSEELRQGKRPGSYHFITFRDAIKRGLYKKVCELSDLEWSADAEQKYIQETYDLYGDGASEELDVIPKKYSSSAIFKEEYFRIINLPNYVIQNNLKVRYFDLAATVSKTSFYSATVMLVRWDNLLVLIDAQAEKYEAKQGDDWIQAISNNDPDDSIILIEQEPGGSGIKYVNYMQEQIPSRYVEGVNPGKDKVIRAIPTVQLLKQGKLAIANKSYYVDGKYITAKDLVKIFCKFSAKPQPLITDLTDCLNGCTNYVNNQGIMWIEDDPFSKDNSLEKLINPFDSSALSLLDN